MQNSVQMNVSAYATGSLPITDSVDLTITIDLTRTDWAGTYDPNNYSIMFSQDFRPSSAAPDGGSTLGLLSFAVVGIIALRRKFGQS